MQQLSKLWGKMTSLHVYKRRHFQLLLLYIHSFTLETLNFCSSVSSNFSKLTALVSRLVSCHSTRNLGFIFDEHFFHRRNKCPVQILLSHPSDSLYLSVPWLQICQYGLPSTVHSKLNYNSLFATLRIFRALLHVLSSELLHSHMPLLFSNFFTGLK